MVARECLLVCVVAVRARVCMYVCMYVCMEAKDSDLFVASGRSFVVRCDYCAAAGMHVRSGRDPSGACQCCV